MNPGSKLASSLLFGKRRGERHTKLSSTCVLYSNVIIYLACMNYISYSWVAVLIVGVVAAGFSELTMSDPTSPLLLAILY